MQSAPTLDFLVEASMLLRITRDTVTGQFCIHGSHGGGIFSSIMSKDAPLPVVATYIHAVLHRYAIEQPTMRSNMHLLDSVLARESSDALNQISEYLTYIRNIISTTPAPARKTS